MMDVIMLATRAWLVRADDRLRLRVRTALRRLAMVLRLFARRAS